MAASPRIAELDVVVTLADVQAERLGEREPLLVQAGTAGTVVLIHYAGSSVAAYEVEFPLGGGEGALAAVTAEHVALASAEHRRACPCCGCRTLADLFPGSYEICPVCFWEDDLVQWQDPNYSGGANRVSLALARENYRAFGACERAALLHVRAPLASERTNRE